VSDDTHVPGRARLGQALAYVRRAEPRVPMSRRAVVTDILIAALALGASLLLVRDSFQGSDVTIVPGPVKGHYLLQLANPLDQLWKHAALAMLLVSVPLAFRRRFPLAAFAVLLAGALITRQYATDITFLAIVFAGYSAVAYSRFTAVQARDRMRRLQAEHEAATRRALEQERARIAAELHDVVTHNVSVMIVQAGAARQVLTESPEQARAALLAVESSGRAAMTELRHLLGLLSPAQDPAGQARRDGEDLRPQPGLGQLQPLIDRVAAAGLPVELHVDDVPQDLPPGLDLAAFRVVQEALTNVIRHAGKPRTSVRLGYHDGDLVVEVSDAGRPIKAAGPPLGTTAGAGRGLLGLRERTALYGGELEAGPQPDGGWRVRARIPVDPPPSGVPAVQAATGLTSRAAGHR
jgi:signal transduction histidine kinase